MKTLILITRGTRAERPSEADILADTLAMMQGQTPVQDPTKDNFFLFKGDPTKNTIRMERQYEGSPYLPQTGDGSSLYTYPKEGTGATELRTWTALDENEEEITVSAKAQVQYIVETSSGMNEYNTLAEARTFIDTLNGSDGYVLIDEGKDTQVIESRPSLWVSEEGKPYDVDLSVKNLHGRSDSDRY